MRKSTIDQQHMKLLVKFGRAYAMEDPGKAWIMVTRMKHTAAAGRRKQEDAACFEVLFEIKDLPGALFRCQRPWYLHHYIPNLKHNIFIDRICS